MGNNEVVLQETQQQLAPEVVNAQSIVLLIVYLVIFIVAIYFITKLISRVSLQKGMKKKSRPGKLFSTYRNEPGSMVSVEDRIILDKSKTITVIEFQGKYYLVGTSEQGFDLLDKVDIPPGRQAENSDESEADDAASDGDAASSTVGNSEPDSSFGGVMGRFWGYVKVGTYRFFHKGKNPPNMDFGVAFQQQLKNKAPQQQYDGGHSGTGSEGKDTGGSHGDTGG